MWNIGHCHWFNEPASAGIYSLRNANIKFKTRKKKVKSPKTKVNMPNTKNNKRKNKSKDKS